MKTPRIILEWACDGIGCSKFVSIAIPPSALRRNGAAECVLTEQDILRGELQDVFAGASTAEFWSV